jgi:hypothetical protein
MRAEFNSARWDEVAFEPTSPSLLLKEKLCKNDWFIDQIVYRLYGLTEEEMKIVEKVRG